MWLWHILGLVFIAALFTVLILANKNALSYIEEEEE